MVTSDISDVNSGLQSSEELTRLVLHLGSSLLISKPSRRPKALTLFETISSPILAAFLFGLALVTPNKRLFVSGMGLLVSLYSLTRPVVLRRERSLAIGLYQNGLTYRTHKSATAVFWDDTRSVTASVLANMVTQETHYLILIQTRLNKSILIETSNRILTEIGIINNVIQRQVAERLWPRALSAFKAGRTMGFGSLLVNRQGLHSGEKWISCSEVKAIDLKRGVVRIQQRNKRRNWANIAFGSLPNALVFVGLAEQVMHQGESYEIRRV